MLPSWGQLDPWEHLPPSPCHTTDADELNVGVVRAQRVGGCAREEGVILGRRHVGDSQEAAVDTALMVGVLRVPGVKGGAWVLGRVTGIAVGPGWSWGSPGILEIQRDPIFGPSEDDVGNTSSTAVEGGRTGAVPSCSHLR